MDIPSGVILTVMLLMQIAASYLCFSTYLHNRRYMPWLAISIAMIMLAFGRTTAMILELGLFPEYAEQIRLFDTIILPLTATLLFLYAFWSIKSEFDSFRP